MNLVWVRDARALSVLTGQERAVGSYSYATYAVVGSSVLDLFGTYPTAIFYIRRVSFLGFFRALIRFRLRLKSRSITAQPHVDDAACRWTKGLAEAEEEKTFVSLLLVDPWPLNGTKRRKATNVCRFLPCENSCHCFISCWNSNDDEDNPPIGHIKLEHRSSNNDD